MPKPKTSTDASKQGPPVTFRPGLELERLVAGIAGGRGVNINEAFKDLAALAAVGLDVGHYDLVSQLAGVMAGRNAFARAALRVRDALGGAIRVDPQFARDPNRTLFVIESVRGQVAEAGQALRPGVVEPLLARLGIPLPQPDDATEQPEPGFQSLPFGKPPAEKVPIRLDE